jgi:ParB family transcriptional regulator, chromosome partitioning protein
MFDPPGNSKKRVALGRGLESLIPVSEARRDLFQCQLNDIDINADQPRSAMNPESLSELAESIRQAGVLQPVLLRRTGERYQLIAGERRVRAARLAGLDRIPALVKQVEPNEVFALALIENIQREDLTPLEEARAFQRLIEEHDFTQKTLAEKVGKARSTIANSLRLLDLPQPVQEHLVSGRLTAGHARAVLSAPPEDREAVAQEMVDGGLSVREAEDRVHPPQDRQTRKPRQRKHAAAQARAPKLDERQASITQLEAQLREALSVRVTIHDRRNGGKIELYYDDDETLQSLVDRLLESPS